MTIHNSLSLAPPACLHSSLHPHHADLSHLSLQLGSRHVLKVVVIAALPAPGIRLHDEVLHVQRSARDPCCVRCLAHRRAELGRSVVPSGLLGQSGWVDGEIEAMEGSKKALIHHFIMCYFTTTNSLSRATRYNVQCDVSLPGCSALECMCQQVCHTFFKH